MEILIARSLIEALRGDRGIFGYSGSFPDEHSPRLIELGEGILSGAVWAAPVKGRLGYVMVEAYQNIVRHRAISPSMAPWSEGRSMFLLRCDNAGQQVFACNLVTHAQAQKLDKDLADLRARNNAELKELYLESIQRASTPGSRGAGLGLIEMVRRAGGGATWAFKPVDDMHDLFAISLVLGDTDGANAFRLEGPLHRLMLGHWIHLFHVGMWTSDMENVLVGLAGNERPAERGDLFKRNAALAQTLDLFRAVCDLSRPVLFALHGEVGATFSIGGMIDGGEAEKLRIQLSDLGVVLRIEDRSEGGKALAAAEVPW